MRIRISQCIVDNQLYGGNNGYKNDEEEEE